MFEFLIILGSFLAIFNIIKAIRSFNQNRKLNNALDKLEVNAGDIIGEFTNSKHK